MDKNFCPALFNPKVIDWGIEDPKGKSIDQIREIRDEIERRTKELEKIVTLGNNENNMITDQHSLLCSYFSSNFCEIIIKNFDAPLARVCCLNF